MVTKKAAAAAAPKSPTVAAKVNDDGLTTTVTFTGTGPGGHSVNMTALTPDKKLQIIEPFMWDGDEGEFVLPYVATEVKVMEWGAKAPTDEIIVQAVEPLSVSEPVAAPPSPEPEPTTEGEPVE